MENIGRELPAYREAMLSKQDVRLNRLPVENLLELYYQAEARVFVDRGLAIQAAASGVPTSSITLTLLFLYPLLLLSAPFAWYFLSWEYALAKVVLAVIVFRACRAQIVARVTNYALDNPRLLDLLISNGTLWFEGVPKSLRVTEFIEASNIQADTRKSKKKSSKNVN